VLHVFLTFSSGVFLQKYAKTGLETRKRFVEIKPVMVLKHVEILQSIS